MYFERMSDMRRIYTFHLFPVCTRKRFHRVLVPVVLDSAAFVGSWQEEISAMPSKSSGDETWKNRQIERIVPWPISGVLGFEEFQRF